jgi:inosine-uridine nucleoside N-ribohydrolase
VSAAPLRVVVDCDPGIDDALALLLLAHHHRAGRVQLCAVVAVAGNVPLERTLANARFVLDQAGLPDVPVIAGAAGPIAAGGRRHADSVHGEDGLGGHGPLPSSRPPKRAMAAAFLTPGRARLEDPLEAQAPPLGAVLERFGRPEPVNLLLTGPLTDTAMALEAVPRLPERMQRVVAMGGAFGSPGGNVTPRAEFNFWADPAAAAVVCRAPIGLELVPLDVTEQVLLGSDALAFLEARLGPSALACRVARSGVELHRRVAGSPAMPLHDPLAAAVLVDPGLVQEVERALSVCVEGPGSGEVQLGEEPPWQRVAFSVDATRAEAAVLDALAGG